MQATRSTGVTCGVLALVLVAVIPSTAAFGFSSAPVTCRQGAFGAMCSARRTPGLRPVSVGQRMAREDGGAGKIPSKPGTGVGNKPGQGAGDGGAGEKERGGAGVAVLTKPPDVDKVWPRACPLHAASIRHLPVLLGPSLPAVPLVLAGRLLRGVAAMPAHICCLPSKPPPLHSLVHLACIVYLACIPLYANMCTHWVLETVLARHQRTFLQSDGLNRGIAGERLREEGGRG